MAEHGIEFVQVDRPTAHGFRIHARRFGHVVDFVVLPRQELVQWGIQQSNGNRQPVHNLEQVQEIAALIGKQIDKGVAAVLFAFGQDHPAHGTIRSGSKNICSVRT